MPYSTPDVTTKRKHEAHRLSVVDLTEALAQGVQDTVHKLTPLYKSSYFNSAEDLAPIPDTPLSTQVTPSATLSPVGIKSARATTPRYRQKYIDIIFPDEVIDQLSQVQKRPDFQLINLKCRGIFPTTKEGIFNLIKANNPNFEWLKCYSLKATNSLSVNQNIALRTQEDQHLINFIQQYKIELKQEHYKNVSYKLFYLLSYGALCFYNWQLCAAGIATECVLKLHSNSANKESCSIIKYSSFLFGFAGSLALTAYISPYTAFLLGPIGTTICSSIIFSAAVLSTICKFIDSDTLNKILDIANENCISFVDSILEYTPENTRIMS